LAQGQYPNRTQAARNWYRNQAGQITGATPAGIFEEKNASLQSSIIPGQMYMFVYDAKTKDKLPYWDRFPLIFPFDYADGGFYGINLHYLNPKLRAVVMDSLYTIVSDNRFDDKTKIKLSYQTLKQFSNHNLIKPCIKRYLNSHVKSRFIFINPIQWDIALWLPTEQFAGASKQKVWADSQRMTNEL
jgi:hypothetical protein